MITVIDTYVTFGNMIRPPFSLSAWKRYADTISPSLAEKCMLDAAEYDFDAQCVPVLNRALDDNARLSEAHQNFLRLTDGLDARFRQCFGCEIDANVIFCLGLCNGAGWATDLDGKPVVLLGVEKIIELGWQNAQRMTGLIYHELGHVWHLQTRTVPDFQQTMPALWQLYAEGMAMYAEQQLVGCRSFFHQGDAQWAQWCAANSRTLFREYLDRIIRRDSVQNFFGDWCAVQGHSDVGYYLGAVLVGKLAETCTSTLLCNCGEEEIMRMLAAMAA